VTHRPSVGQPGYLPYCGACEGLVRMIREANHFTCPRCNMQTRRINGEDMFDRTAPSPAAAAKASFAEDHTTGNAHSRRSIKHSYTTEGKNYVD
jgi:hypothetical protein